MATASVGVTWVQGDQFVAAGTGGHSVVLDAPHGREQWEGMKPSEMLLAALGGCAGVDVIDILTKMRLSISAMQISVQGEQAPDPPREFRHIMVHFQVRGHHIPEAAVQRAIALGLDKYCTVAATIRGVATIETSYTIIDDEIVDEETTG